MTENQEKLLVDGLSYVPKEERDNAQALFVTINECKHAESSEKYERLMWLLFSVLCGMITGLIFIAILKIYGVA